MYAPSISLSTAWLQKNYVSCEHLTERCPYAISSASIPRCRPFTARAIDLIETPLGDDGPASCNLRRTARWRALRCEYGSRFIGCVSGRGLSKLLVCHSYKCIPTMIPSSRSVTPYSSSLWSTVDGGSMNCDSSVLGLDDCRMPSTTAEGYE